MFTLLIHADWSVSPNKRWAARARQGDDGWLIEAVEPVGDCSAFVRTLSAAGHREAVLAGFDFPLGVPDGYGALTGLSSFPDFLQAIGQGQWAEFTNVARHPNDISVRRPFFPHNSNDGWKQGELTKALAVQSFDELLRSCERKTLIRRAACSVFWTTGPSQVGRAALAGWTEVIKPAQAAGARLWPFDGSLASLSERPGLVLAETYPAEAYSHVGVVFRSTESKTRQEDRASKADAIFGWASKHDIHLSASVRTLIADGFGSDKAGEDRFDALLGLCGMIEVVTGRRAEGGHPADSVWEGWILGQERGPQPDRASDRREGAGAPKDVTVQSAPTSVQPWQHAARAVFDRPLIQNSHRAMLAEALVDLALPTSWRWCSEDWSSWDFEHQDGTRLEVKHSAARQSWSPPSASPRRSFDIAPRTGRWENGDWISDAGRAADLYVFAFHPVTNDAADHRKADQWEFYVVPSASLPATKSVSLATVRALSNKLGHVELGARVEALRIGGIKADSA